MTMKKTKTKGTIQRTLTTTKLKQQDGTHKDLEQHVEIERQEVELSVEPDFAKLYLQDLAKLLSLSGGELRLLLKLAQLANYDGKVAVPIGIKREIESEVGMNVRSISNALVKLVKHEFIKNLGGSVYLISPEHIAKGRWREVIAKRKAFKMTVEYSEKGRTITTDSIEDSEPKTNIVQMPTPKAML